MAKFKIREIDGKYEVYDPRDESGEPGKQHDRLEEAQAEAWTKSYDEGYEKRSPHPEDNE